MIESAQPERRETIREIRARHKPKEQLPSGWTSERAQEHEVYLSREREAQLAALSTTDELTGIENRRSFEHNMKAQFRRFAGGHENVNNPMTISIAFIDGDSFKKINDTYGHPAGDKVIKTIATTLSSTVREGIDHVCRMGGDEFAIGFVDVDRETVLMKMNKLVEQMGASKIVLDDGRIVKVTLSIGGTTAIRGSNKGPRSYEEAINQADTALYQAKADGGNRIVLSLNSAGGESVFNIPQRDLN